MRIVVYDASNVMAPGTLFEGNVLISSLNAKGVRSLEVDKRVRANVPLDAYYQRFYGAGFPYDSHMPGRVCGAMMRVKQVGNLHWMLGFKQLDPAKQTRGQLNIAGDSRMDGGMSGMRISQFEPAMFEVQPRGMNAGQVAVLQGEATFGSTQDGIACLMLWGYMSNATILWFACTQSE